MNKTKRNIRCVWDGSLSGILLKNDAAAKSKSGQKTTKILGMHGWLDNLNAMLPLAEKLINRRPNYEIYLYDRSGHGFSTHLPTGFDYAIAQDLQDMRTVVKTLGWDKEQIIIIGHSYGGSLGTMYAAGYPDDVLCLVAIDALPRGEASADQFFQVLCSRIDNRIAFHNTSSNAGNNDLTIAQAIEVIISTRPGLTKEAAKLLTERAVRPDEDNNLQYTRDEVLQLAVTIAPMTDEMVRGAVLAIKAFVLFIGTTNPHWTRDLKPYDLLKEHNPSFEMILIDRPHHLHMTHPDEVADLIEQYFDKHFP